MIRPLTESDLARIKEIDRAAFSPEDQYGEATYLKMLDSGLSLVAVDDAEFIVGYAFLQRLQEWPWEDLSDLSTRPTCMPHSHVRSIAVDPSRQRNGYGRAILRSVIEAATNSVDLLVDESNEPALRLYESLGFKPAEMCATVPPKRRMALHTQVHTPRVELIEVSDSDFDWMLGIVQYRESLRLPPGGVDDPGVLRIVREMTQKLHAAGCTGSWMIVRDGEVVGLCSYKRPPARGRVEIGYGIAPQRRDAGTATAAVAAIAQIASADPTIDALIAETATNNPASQRVLEKNGFIRAGSRIDEEDGEVVSWIKMLHS